MHGSIHLCIPNSQAWLYSVLASEYTFLLLHILVLIGLTLTCWGVHFTDHFQCN